MTEVSCQVTCMLLEAVEASGLSVSRLLEGFPHDDARLRDTRARISWDDLTVFLERLEELTGGPDGMYALGLRVVNVPAYGFVRRFARIVVGGRQLNRIAFHWLGPALWPHLVFRMREPDERTMVVTCEVPEPYRPSLPFFHLCRGSVAALTTLIDLPVQEVRAELTARRSDFTIALPAEPPLLARTLRRVRGRFSTRAALAELEKQQVALTESYRALLRTRQDFRELIAAIPDGVIVHRDGAIRWANLAVARLLGFEDASALIGTPLLTYVDQKDHARLLARLRSPASSSPIELQLVRKDGQAIFCEIASTELADFEGSPARLVVGRDITERRRMQEQLVVADKMASLGMIAAGVAHEINNPLAYAFTSVELASKALDGGGDRERIRESLSIAREGLERVRGIVGDLRTFSRADEVPVGALDVHAVLDATLTLAAAQIRPRARIVRDYGAVPLVSGNDARLGQVFLNLLINAAEALPAGQPSRHTIRVRTEPMPEGRVAVLVSDSGTGVPPEVAPRIFEPFFTTKRDGGTGLGLAICARIVAQLGGEIRLESNPEAELRTTFRVILPAAEAAVRPSRLSEPPPLAAPPRAVRRGRVLVVDDEPGILNVILRSLGEQHDVTVATSGEAALRLARESPFDVLLCDVMMPGMSGVDLVQSLHASQPEVARRVIFMTGGAFSPEVRDKLAALPNPCLEKPFRLEDLLEHIAAHLRAGDRAAPSRTALH